MADVNEMLDEIITREGGFVNNPNDRGGATKYGITQATLSDWLGHAASVEDVQNLTVDTAKDIYEKNYLTRPGIAKLPDGIQAVMLDGAVNSGPGNSIKWLQDVLNTKGYGPLTVDGGIGPKTIAAAQKAWDEMTNDLNTALVERRRQFIQALVAKDPSQQVFLKGWMARLDGLESSFA